MTNTDGHQHATDLLLTVNQVAVILHTTPWTVSRWEKQGRLPPAQRPGRNRRFLQSDIEAYLEKRGRFNSEVSPCPACGRRWLGMDAPVDWLIGQAEELRGQYGWVSAALLQRRVRVTKQMAAYLMAELEDRAGQTAEPAHWGPVERPTTHGYTQEAPREREAPTDPDARRLWREAVDVLAEEPGPNGDRPQAEAPDYGARHTARAEGPPPAVYLQRARVLEAEEEGRKESGV